MPAQDDYVGVRRFGVFSIAKTAAIFGVAAGLVLLIALVAVAALGMRPGFQLGFGLGAGIVLLFVSIVGLFVGGAVDAFLYNAIAKVTGPVRIVIHKGVIGKVDPLSYAKVSLVFGFIIYGLLALFASSLLLSAVGIDSASVALSSSLIEGAFVFALVVYGFILPYAFASLYNWLSGRIGGIGILLSKGVLKQVDVGSYVKVMLIISAIVFIVGKVIGAVVGLALRIPLSGSALSVVAGFLALVVASLVVNSLAAWFYNRVAKRFGGLEIELEG